MQLIATLANLTVVPLEVKLVPLIMKAVGVVLEPTLGEILVIVGEGT